MTNDQESFKDLNKYIISKVKIGNCEFILVNGKRIMDIENLTFLKNIANNMKLTLIKTTLVLHN